MTSAQYADAPRAERTEGPVASVPNPHAAPSAAHGGTEVGFIELFREFGAYVPGLLRRLGVAEREVEDVAQDVFTVIHRQLPGFRGDSALKTWVCGVTLRVARTHLRLARVRKLFLGEPPAPPSHQATQFESALLRERVLMLQHALEQLSQDQRRVFVLYEIEELSMREIAQLVGCPEKTAYTRLHAARGNVERCLRRRLAIGGAP
jgi:RNA polymerase sigma-70 factor (ECF subfamily)